MTSKVRCPEWMIVSETLLADRGSLRGQTNCDGAEMRAQLSIKRSDLKEGLRVLRKLGKSSAASDITLSYDNGDLFIDRAGIAASMPADGQWNGVATAPAKILDLLATARGALVNIAFSEDGRLHVDQMSFEALWHDGSLPQTDLPLDPPLLEILRLRHKHSEEELISLGLRNRVVQAERERDQIIQSAADKLKPLGDFKSLVQKIVHDEVRRA